MIIQKIIMTKTVFSEGLINITQAFLAAFFELPQER